MATRTYTALFNLKANSKREIRSSPTSFPRPDLPTFIQTYSAGKSCSAVQAYIAKGGNYIDWGTFQLDGRNKSFGDEMSDVYIAAFATRDKGKALEVIQKSNPKDNINPKESRPKSLILEGLSRTGKTSWARSLEPHNYYMGQHNDDVWYNVIDDVDS